MYTKEPLHNHQISLDLVARQAHFAFRDGPGRDSYPPFCDFYTYDDKLNVGQCFQSVEHVLFNEGTDDFFVDRNGVRETDCSTYQPLDVGAEGQVITFNTLREDFAGQVFLPRHPSGATAPVIAATMPIQNGTSRANNPRQASLFRGPRM